MSLIDDVRELTRATILPESEQKAVIVRSTGYTDPCNDLNTLLKAGWSVHSTCPMPSSGSSGGNSTKDIEFPPTCLVVLVRMKPTPPSTPASK